MKLALGTVQFGMNYGISNVNGIPDNFEIEKIFQLAWENNIKTIDTASVYGGAEKKIGILAKQNFEIVSKFKISSENTSVSEQLENSLISLNRKSIYGYLAHNVDELLNDLDLWKCLEEERGLGKVQKIGYSIYNIDQLQKLLNKGLIPDIIQLPYNLLDRRFDVFFDNLKKNGVEIHIRSAFLQGLYFMDLNSLGSKFEPIKNDLAKIKSICNENKISIESLALNFVIMNPLIDKLLIGVDTLYQLQSNIDGVKKWNSGTDIFELVKDINVSSPELLNPINW